MLDVGCGDGNFTGPAAAITGSAVGVDRSPEMLAAAARRFSIHAGVRWVHAQAEALPLPPASFDVVLAVTIMCFADDPAAIVREVARVLRPGGRVILGELVSRSPWAWVRRVRGLRGGSPWRGARFFTPRELRRLLEDAGFHEVTTAGAVFFPPLSWRPAVAFAPLLERAGRRCVPWSAAFLATRGHRE